MKFESEIKTVDFKLESVIEENGKFYFTAVSLDTNFEPVEGLKRLAIRSINKDYIWRHNHPLEDVENEVFGRVDNSWVDETDGKLFSKYEVFDYDHKKKVLIDLIKEKIDIGDPLGVSMRYRKYIDKNLQSVVHYDVFEHSGTPIPACEKCRSIDYEVINMANEEKKKTEEEILEESKAKIIKLEAELDEKTKCFEDLQTKVVSLEKEMEDKADSILEEEKKAKTLEEKVEELTLEVDYLNKKPIIDKMLELKKLDERHISFYKTQDKKYLGTILEEMKLESKSAIQVKSQEEGAEEITDIVDEELEKDKGKKKSFEDFTKELNLKKKGEK